MSTSPNPIESSGARRASCGPTKVFKGHTKKIWSVAYFPDGRRIAGATNEDKTVIIWDVKSGRQDGQPLLHDSSVRWIAISPNGSRIASGMEGGMVVWDALTRQAVHEIKGGVYRLAYSPDGRWIATAPTDAAREIWLWDADTGRLGRKPLRCDGDVFCVAFSPDGTRIAAGFEDGSFQVMNISTGDSVVGPINGHTEGVLSAVYSTDGRLLITASRDSSICVWDSKTGLEVGEPMLGHEDAIDCISITADGRRIASGGWDKTVRVWDLETRLRVGDSFDAPGLVFSVAFSPDERYIISGGDGDVFLWDTESSAIQGRSSPTTTSNRIPPAPIAQHIPTLRQQRQARTKSHNDRSSINSSLLDLPAVVQQQPATQQERKPSVDDDWDTESMRPPLRPTEPQQDPPPESETLTAQPAVPNHKWSRNIRERWRHIRHRKSRVQTDLSDRPPHPPIPLRGRAHSSASPELSTNRQARRERNADAQQNAQGAHSRTRPSRNQIEPNVALGQADVRLAIAAPRGKKGRRFRERARRGGVRANSHLDTDSGSQDSDGESEYEDTVCLDAICYWVLRRRRHLQGR